MQTRSMTRKENNKRQKMSHDDGSSYDCSNNFNQIDEYNFHHNREEYDKEQERRRRAGIKPVIICMGGPYSDAWYPPR